MRSPENIGFKILSLILRFNTSTIKKTDAPLNEIIIFFITSISGSNMRNTINAVKNDATKPAIYPITVFLLPFGKCRLPNLIPNNDAAPSPRDAINAAAANTLIGKKKIGTKERTNAAVAEML